MRIKQYPCALAICLLTITVLPTSNAHFLNSATCGRDDSPDVLRRMTSFTDNNVDDVSFVDNLLFEVNARSEHDCGQECLRHEICVTFTYTPMTSRGVCRGHHDVMRLADSNLAATGSITFVHTKALQCSQMDEGFSWQAAHCVRPFNVSMSFDDAEQTCLQHGGGHIIHLKTHEDLQLLQCIIAKLGWQDTNMWLGADDKQTEGDFRWSDGSILPNNSDWWAAGQPNNAKGLENCVALAPYNKFVDRRCDGVWFHAYVFVCQIYM